MVTYLYLIPVSLGLGLVGLASFFWSLEAGQYDDLAGSSQRIFVDADLEPSLQGSGKRLSEISTPEV